MTLPESYGDGIREGEPASAAPRNGPESLDNAIREGEPPLQVLVAPPKGRRMRWTIADSIGLLVASFITTVPLVLMIGVFAGNILHPVQPHECLVPALIAMAATVVSSVFVSWSEGLATTAFGERVMRHLEFAILTAVLLNVTFFHWWGNWALQVSGRQAALPAWRG